MWVSWYQKSKTNLYLLEQEKWVVVVSAGPYANVHLAQTDNHTSIPPLRFLQAGWPSCCATNNIKALKLHYDKVTGSEAWKPWSLQSTEGGGLKPSSVTESWACVSCIDDRILQGFLDYVVTVPMFCYCYVTSVDFCLFLLWVLCAVGWVAGRTSETERWNADVVICLGWGTDLHMAQLMPLPLTILLQ